MERYGGWREAKCVPCMPHLEESDGGSALPPITASAGGELSMGSHGREDDHVGLAALRTHEG